MWLLGMFSLLAGLVLTGMAGYWLLYFLPFRCDTCKGFLNQSVHEKDKQIRRTVFRDYVSFSYRYRVNGESYICRGGVQGKKADLPTTVQIVFQKKHPKHAYIRNVMFPIQTVVGGLLLPLGLLVLIVGIGLILG